jgi:hypothetical protein
MNALEKLDAQARLRVAPDLCWIVRGVPIDVRAMADAAADERQQTLGDWLTNAIIDRARFEAGQALQARTVQDPLAGAPWDETPQAAVQADPADPVLLAPETPSDVISDLDTDALEALALEALLPETLSPEAQAIEALAVEVQIAEVLASEVPESEVLVSEVPAFEDLEPELYGPPTPVLLSGQAEAEVSAITEVAAPDEMAAILDSVRAIVAFAKLDGDTLYGPGVIQAPAPTETVGEVQPETTMAESAQALWGIPAETELDADCGTVFWFVDPDTLGVATVEAETELSEAVTLEAAAPEEVVLLSEPVTLTLIEPEIMAEAPAAETASVDETWLPKAAPEPKKSLLRRLFRR